MFVLRHGRETETVVNVKQEIQVGRTDSDRSHHIIYTPLSIFFAPSVVLQCVEMIRTIFGPPQASRAALVLLVINSIPNTFICP